MRTIAERIRQYEMMTIFTPELSEEDLPSAIDHVTQILTGSGATITHMSREAPWGRRRLAYPIRHSGRDMRDGFYVLYYFDIDASRLTEVERDLKLFESLMRHMVTLQVQPPAQPEPEPDADAPAAESEGADDAATEGSANAEEASEPAETAEAPAEAADAPAESTEEAAAETEAGADTES